MATPNWQKIFEAAWNRVNILKDSNHLLKNIRKNIQENANLKCIKNVILLHQNNSEYVQESEIENQNSFSITPQLIELNEIIDVLSDRSEELFQAGSTNRCESFMNSRTKFIEKRFNSSKQWEMRCQFSVLNRELPEWKNNINGPTRIKYKFTSNNFTSQKNLEKQYEKN
ncbi:hypothetical protein M0813_19721 [Anaeramoeba flamelloides]|uniref:Uncharacterized protein n=1 Tax=Anaeramoeba flamelloides TaxID=1746091 RepID=A0ABQ8YMX7_9EUKA|nr:hypothetical protein M0813_19721 [Anaeramoeba flamelloides]